MTVLDQEVLGDLEHDLGDRDFVREIVQLYLNQLDQRRRAVIDAITADDLPRVQREAHTLASASAMVGALELRDLCKELEYSDIPAGDLATDPRLLSWPRMCDEVKAALTGWLART